ncbi:MAG TPA: hypothetical protein VFH80_35380 [Solirubrobacteraceae bacterium]|nr:hypothetical protein [Solirubrobacteraceae bacterium]
MRRIVLSVVACCALAAFIPASALAHGHHHKRHHSRVHHRTFGHDWNQSGSSTTSTSSDQNAGTVQSFTGGVLTIALNNGQTVSGAVTGDTEIECEAADMSSSLRSHDHGDGGGDNGDDQGDDNGNDQGDNDNENANCSSADLTPGTVVHEARLRLSGAGATWDKVELVTASATDNNNDNDNDDD